MHSKKIGLLGYLVVQVAILTAGCNRHEDQSTPSNDTKSQEDITLILDVQNGDEIHRVEFKIKGSKARSDSKDTSTSTIHDPNQGITILDHVNKLHQKVPLPAIPSPTELSPEIKEILTESFEMRFTGEKKKIGSWDCEKFIIFDSYTKDIPISIQSKIVAWIARDFKEGASIQARKDRLAPNQLVELLNLTASTKLEMPGFAVRTDSVTGNGPHTVSTCAEIRHDPLDSEIFEIPASYKEVSIP